MGIFNEFYKKEKPVFTGITRGMGGFGFGAGAGDSGPSGPVLVASGGTKSTPGDGYTYHVFTNNQSFSVTTGGEDIEIMLVGGGGGGEGGGDSAGGGGGAGGLVYRHSVPVNSGDSFPIVIGGGGPGASSGGNTTGFSLTALGGGKGCGRSTNATPGGCGGGGSAYSEGPRAGASGDQPGQNPGVPNLTQYGGDGWDTNDPSSDPNFTYNTAGGSGNANNNTGQNATFPNNSTILSGSPIGSNNIARGGYYSPPGSPTPWSPTDYGSGGRGTPGGNIGGVHGVCVVRYGKAP